MRGHSASDLIALTSYSRHIMRHPTPAEQTRPSAVIWQSMPRFFCVILRSVTGAIFAAAGLLKLVYPDEFVDALASHDLLPPASLSLVGLALAHVEIVLGLLLVFGLKVRMVSNIMIVLLLFFSLLGAAALIRGRTADCGCFPIAGRKEPIGSSLFIRNLLLISSCLLLAQPQRVALLASQIRTATAQPDKAGRS